jgi:hypothetical protein
MSARLNRPVISSRTWISLTLIDAAIWVIAEVQHSGGSLRTAFDAVWLASFFGFILLLAVGLTGAVQSRRRARRVSRKRRDAPPGGSVSLTDPETGDTP